MDHLKFIVSSQKEESISIQRVSRKKYPTQSLIGITFLMQHKFLTSDLIESKKRNITIENISFKTLVILTSNVNASTRGNSECLGPPKILTLDM